ncbi:AEC family transporter [Sulfurivirga sp.]|uniref:AEC family transporter n=1 Tax=Sulfurivirga sp. TaxID=2614236 RepID=UPI0025D19FAE|nr:AEC family transporter [Sulfurivirga sp.]
MENLTLVALCVLIGLLLQRVHVFHAAPEVLNAWVIWVALPAVILHYLPQIHFSADLLGLVVVPWTLLAFTAGLVLWLGRLFGWSRNTIGALLMLAPLGNTSFLGIPMLEALLGDQSIPYALVYDQAGSFLAVVLYLPFVAAFYAGDGQFSWRRVLHKMFTFPPMIAALVTFATWTLPRPDWLESNLIRLADTLVPVAMVAVGLQLKLRLPQGLGQPFAVGMALKMGLMPLMALWLIQLLEMRGLPARTALLEAAMPTMITAGAVAASHNLQPRLAAAMVGWGVLAAFITLPLWSLVGRSL